VPPAIQHSWPVTAFDLASETVVLGHHEVRDGDPTTVLRVHELGSGAVRAAIELHGEHAALEPIACAHDGARVALGGVFGDLSVWDTRLGTIAPLGSHEHVQELAFDPSDRWLASAGRDGHVRLWDLPGRKLAADFLNGGYINGLAWRPDGRRLATISDVVRFVDVPGATFAGELGPHIVYARTPLAWTADGARIAAAHGTAVAIWDVASGKSLLEVEGREGSLSRQAAWSPDGKLLALAGGLSDEPTVRVRDGATGRLLVELHLDGVPRTIGFLAGERLAVATEDGAVGVWPLDAILHGPPPRRVLEEAEAVTKLRVDDVTLELEDLSDR